MSQPRKAARRNPLQAPPDAPLHPFDRLYGTDTGGLIPGAAILTGHRNDRHLTAYYGTAPSILDGLLERWTRTLPPGDLERWTFVDFGAGKGRVILAAATHPFQEVLGIEIHPGLASIAQQNLSLFIQHGDALAPARILLADVLEAELPPAPLLGFLFHPFEAPLLRALLRRLEAHVGQKSPAPCLDLLYVNAEHIAVLDASPGWRRLFYGPVRMSPEDYIADLAEIENQAQYGSTGDEICAIYRWTPDLQTLS